MTEKEFLGIQRCLLEVGGNRYRTACGNARIHGSVTTDFGQSARHIQ
jgi:hypothetical protein